MKAARDTVIIILAVLALLVMPNCSSRYDRPDYEPTDTASPI